MGDHQAFLKADLSSDPILILCRGMSDGEPVCKSSGGSAQNMLSGGH